jgi:hypothetical protein
MSETSEFEIAVGNTSGVPIYIGDKQLRLCADNTTIWRYDYEDRRFDHCVVELEGQATRCFLGEGELLNDLEKIYGCPVIDEFDVADVETRADYRAWANYGIDDLRPTA